MREAGITRRHLDRSRNNDRANRCTGTRLLQAGPRVPIANVVTNDPLEMIYEYDSSSSANQVILSLLATDLARRPEPKHEYQLPWQCACASRNIHYNWGILLTTRALQSLEQQYRDAHHYSASDGSIPRKTTLNAASLLRIDNIDSTAQIQAPTDLTIKQRHTLWGQALNGLYYGVPAGH